jgi:hypothetical protein
MKTYSRFDEVFVILFKHNPKKVLFEVFIWFEPNFQAGGQQASVRRFAANSHSTFL